MTGIQVGEAHENLKDNNIKMYKWWTEISCLAVVRIHHGVEMGPVFSVPYNGKLKR